MRAHEGLVLASDSRTNSGIDRVRVCRKMHNFAVLGERMFAILSSASLSVTQSVMTRLQHEFQTGSGLATVSKSFGSTQAVKDALFSLDSTMRSNVAVGPPIDVRVHGTDEFAVRRYRRLAADDPDLVEIRGCWERELRRAIGEVPTLAFPTPGRPDEFFTVVTADD